MIKNNIYKLIYEAAARGIKQLALLIDPDKFNENHFKILTKHPQFSKFSFVFVGGSLLSNYIEACIIQIKRHTDKPVIIFPGNAAHISHMADAVLLLSLISGRNAEFLIGNHVLAAPFLKQSGIETISTGYMLIGNRGNSSVEYMSNTRPIPASKTDIAVATALAGEMIGMNMMYLEAGSGSEEPVPVEMIRAVKSTVNTPVIVGGGIKSTRLIQDAFEAGADIVVIGTAFENNLDLLDKIMQ